MPSPFPGMDPYLEGDETWMGFNLQLSVGIVWALNRLLRPKFYAGSDTRFFEPLDDDPAHGFDPNLFGRPVRDPKPAPPATDRSVIADSVLIQPNDPLREHRVEITRTATHELVTVIEFRSPGNKTLGSAARASFVAKRDDVLAAGLNWVEIDLTREGAGHPSRRRLPRHQYHVVSSPTALRPSLKVWPIRLTDPLPVIGIPFGPDEPEVPLDLQAVFAELYDRSAYEVRFDYQADPTPPLPPDLAKWADALLRKKKLR